MPRNEAFTKGLDLPGRVRSAATKAPKPATHDPTRDQLRAMTTDELVKMLLSPDMARSMNESLRQQIIEILQQREGNAFVQRLRGKSTKRKIDKHRLAACQESASDYEKARL